MTDFMTPRGHMANLVALSKSATPFGEIGVCPLTKTTIQLLPMRYGLVEPDLDPRADMAMPYTLQSRPLGLRMLRDGFLYVIDSATGLLSEYTVKHGSLEYWLFTGKDIKEHRTPLGDPPEMISPGAACCMWLMRKHNGRSPNAGKCWTTPVSASTSCSAST